MEQRIRTAKKLNDGNFPAVPSGVVLYVFQSNVQQANIFGNNQQNESEVIIRLIESYEKQLKAKDEQINKLIETIRIN